MLLFKGSGSETTGGEQLNLEQMAGIFIVLAAGIGLGLISMVFEYIFAASADSFRDRQEGVRTMLNFLPYSWWFIVLELFNVTHLKMVK